MNFILSPIRRLKELLAKPDSKTLLGNFTSLGILQVLNYLLPLVTLPYLTKVIGIEMFGVLAVAAAIIVYFQTFVDFGFNYSATRDIANNQKNIDIVSKIYWTTMVTKFILMFISLAVLLLIIAIIPYFRENYLVILLTFLFIPCVILLPEWLFQGLEKMRFITILNVISKSIFTIMIFLVIREKSDYLLQPVLLAAGNLVAGITANIIIFKQFGVKPYRPSVSDIKNSIKGSYNIFINLLLPNLYNSLSTLLLGYWWGSSAAGLLDAAKKIINLSDQAMWVLSRTFFPYLAKNLTKHFIYVRLSLSFSFIMVIIFYFGADVIVKLLYAAEFEGAKDLLRILAISPLIMSIINAYGTNYLILVHKERILRNITFFSSVAGLFAALILVYNFKAVGAALALLFARGLIAGLSYYYSIRVRMELVPGKI